MRSASLACLSGILHVTLLPPLSWHWLAWIVLIPFLWSLIRSSVLHGGVLGAVFGIQLSVAVYWWLPDMLVRFFDLPVSIAWSAGMLGAFFLAVPYAGFGIWVAYLSRHGRAFPVSIASGWVLAEFASGRWLVPNRLGLLAHSQIGSSASQVLDLVGQYGLGFLIVAVNAVIVTIFADRCWKSFVRPTSLVVAAALLCTVTYGLRQEEEVYGVDPDIKVAVLQGGVQLGFDQIPDQRFESFDQYRALTLRVTENETLVDLVFWPEWAAGVYLGGSSEESQMHVAALAGFGPELVVGAPHKAQVEDVNYFYNSVFLLRSGSIEGRYDKQELIPLAESDPLAGIGGFLNRRSYTPGPGPSVLPSLSGDIGVMVCSESTNPVVARELVRVGAKILANPSNDYWFGRREPALLQLGVAGMRAIENRRYLVRPTSTGLSAVIAPAGNVLIRSSTSGAELLVASVRRVSILTVYQKFGDLIAWVSVSVVLWQLVRIRFRRREL